MTGLSSPGVEITGEMRPQYARILTAEAVDFIAQLQRRFDHTRQRLLERRQVQQQAFNAGARPDFLRETVAIRESEWTIGTIPADLQDRRVEITGPVDRKMIIHALNSGANVFMADFEDALTPTWDHLLAGQINLADAVDGTIELHTGDKHYRLNERIATLIVRPRGWHLPEKHVRIDGRLLSASLFDFGLYFFHNAKKLLAKGSGPYFYLPKLESYLEARLWNDVFIFAQQYLGLPIGTIKATVLIETITAAFEMDEILYELRDHGVGLNCGRWDYIFSFIKKFQADPAFILPDRQQLTMTCHFLRAYSLLLIKTCHRRGAFAIGGMAAQIPIKYNPEANAIAFDKVRADKEREVIDGHDGTWVAHPALVSVASEVFQRHLPTPHQITRQRNDVCVNAADLLKIPQGTRTPEGLRNNVSVALQYLASWLTGNACIPLYDLMEDAATAEIARAQLWQWHRHGAKLSNGHTVTTAFIRRVLAEEAQVLQAEWGARYEEARFPEAVQLLEQMITAEHFSDFFTLVAYQAID